ncbi:MAG: polysaccharide deacetylase family protein [Anaerolineales bacterium]
MIEDKYSFLLRYYRAQQKRYPSILWQGDGSRCEIALTFDDGPHPKDTPQVLERLARHEVRATFFLVGKYVEQYPHFVQQIHQAGHYLGIHCYRHIPFPLEKPKTLQAQLDRTRNAIVEACGSSVKTICHIRPPYGAFTQQTLSLLNEWGYHLVMWNSIPPHWMQPLHWTTQQVLKNAIPGSVIVLHDGHGHGTKVAQILDMIIPSLKSRTFAFVTVDQLHPMESAS